MDKSENPQKAQISIAIPGVASGGVFADLINLVNETKDGHWRVILEYDNYRRADPRGEPEPITDTQSMPTTTDKPALGPALCSPCGECGMPVEPNEYHPFGVCLMFKGCYDSATVRANLWAIQERSYDIGRRAGENCKPSTEAVHGQANETN